MYFYLAINPSGNPKHVTVYKNTNAWQTSMSLAACSADKLPRITSGESKLLVASFCWVLNVKR